MIVPDGAVLRLDPRDDLPHAPEPAGNYNESAYVDLFDSRSGLGLWLRLGERPNEGHAEVSLCLHLPDGRIACWFARPEIGGDARMEAAGLRIEVVEPFRRLVVAYDGPLLMLDDPRALLDPGAAFRTAPRETGSLRLDLRGLSPMHGGEIVSPDGSPFPLDPEQSAYRGHLEQHVAGRGEVAVGGVRWTVDGFGYRDKSWGPRHWRNFHWHKWTPVTFGPDLGAMLALMGRPDAPAVVTGTVWRDGLLQPVRHAELDARYDREGRQEGLTVRLDTDSGGALLEGETLAWTPLRHRATLPDGSQAQVRIIKAMTLYRMDGREALGMSEFLDVMRDGRPVSQLGSS